MVTLACSARLKAAGAAAAGCSTGVSSPAVTGRREGLHLRVPSGQPATGPGRVVDLPTRQRTRGTKPSDKPPCEKHSGDKGKKPPCDKTPPTDTPPPPTTDPTPTAGGSTGS